MVKSTLIPSLQNLSSCTFSQYIGNDDYETLSKIHLTDLQEVNINNCRCLSDHCTHIVPELAMYSDYSNGILHVANNIAFKKYYKNSIQEIYGSFNTCGIAIPIIKLSAQLLTVLADLEAYSVIDEDILADCTFSAIIKEWNTWAKADFIDLLEKRFYVTLNISEDKETHFFQLFEESRKKAGLDWAEEAGPHMYIELEDVLKYVDKKNLSPFIKT